VIVAVPSPRPAERWCGRWSGAGSAALSTTRRASKAPVDVGFVSTQGGSATPVCSVDQNAADHHEAIDAVAACSHEGLPSVAATRASFDRPSQPVGRRASGSASWRRGVAWVSTAAFGDQGRGACARRSRGPPGPRPGPRPGRCPSRRTPRRRPAPSPRGAPRRSRRAWRWLRAAPVAVPGALVVPKNIGSRGLRING
jgi:hypothetical protein